MDNESQQDVSRANGSIANPEVEAKRRRFTAEYKARILAEVDASPGQSGAILGRETRRGLLLTAKKNLPRYWA